MRRRAGADDGAGRSRDEILLVVQRELRQRLRGPFFYVSTGLVVALIIGLGGLLRLVDPDSTPSATVALAGEVPEGVEAALASAGDYADLELDTEVHPDATKARAALVDGDVDAVLDLDDGTVSYPDEEDEALHGVLQQVWVTTGLRASLLDQGLSPEEVETAMAADVLDTRLVEVDGDSSEESMVFLVGIVAGALLFGSLQTYGNYILTGVVEEKSTAVIEVLLARMRAGSLLAGKVLGIGAMALLQFALILAAAVVGLLISGTSVPGPVWAALPWTGVWFLAGFATYAFLYGLAGVLVSRQEDAQSAATPVSTCLITGYILMFVFVGDPGHVGVRVLSLFPPFTPMLMPMRVAAEVVHPIEMAVALVMTGITVGVLATFSGRVYANLVLQRGSRVRWTDALRLRD